MIAAYNREVGYTRDYHGRELLVLLQNADDAAETMGSKAKIVLTPQRLCVANTGKYFAHDGVLSLIVSDKSPKQLDRSRYIGNKGLGFRSILSWTDSPFILSGDLSMTFSRSYSKLWMEELCSKSEKV